MLKEKLEFFRTFHSFIKERKLQYLYPIFFALLFVLLIVIIAEIPGIGPFIYTIF